MKRTYINNEFTQWAEYLARYFGSSLAIYSVDGELMAGDKYFSESLTQKELYNTPSIYPIYKDIAEPIAFYDMSELTGKECEILKTIIPFIESQLDDEEGA